MVEADKCPVFLSVHFLTGEDKMTINGPDKFSNPFDQGGNSVQKFSNGSFGKMVKGFIEDVNMEQHEAKSMTEDFIHGGDVEIHDVMIAGEKAKTSLELLMQIRNKTIDMYKEINRIPV